MFLDSINSFIKKSERVLRVSHHPRSKEFWMIAKVTALGVILMGLIGFLITFIFAFIG